MPLELRRSHRAKEFLHSGGDFLSEAEAENNMAFSLALAREDLDEEIEGAVVRRGDRVLVAGFRTPPHKLLLCVRGELPSDALRVLADDFVERVPNLGAVLGRSDASAAFARQWERSTGQSVRIGMRQRIHRLVRVAEDLPPVDGRLRFAEAADAERVADWTARFTADAGVPPPKDSGADARHRIESGRLVFWETDRVVSMAGFGGETPRGVRLNLVYSPEEERGRGYATGCVAELTRRLLARGHEFCVLYTDLANATSNRIYARIGYEPIQDVDDWALGG